MLTKTIAATGSSALSATTEHLVCVTWSTERDSNGKLQQSRVKIYADASKLVDQTYTDIQEWFYNNATFIIANSTSNAQLRDIKIWPGPLTDQDVTNLYVAG